MRAFIFFFLFILLIASCSEERQILNNIQGVYETTEFVVSDIGTDSVLFTASPTFDFSECTPRSNSDGGQCEVTIVDTDGTTYDYRYQLNAGQGTDYITFYSQEASTEDEENDLARSLTPNLVFELRNEELKLFTGELSTIRTEIGGSRDYRVSIVAMKR